MNDNVYWRVFMNRYSKIALLCTLLCGSASAHHSTANFDRSIETHITGTVTHVNFTNPHSVIELDVDTGAGAAEHYTVFATSKVVLLRYGWSPNSVQQGDTISVSGYPDRKEPHFLYMSNITFRTGEEWSRSEVLE